MKVEERSNGLHGAFRIKPGPEGDRVLADVRGGYYGGFSVEFHPVTCVRDPHDGVRQVLSADLLGVALVGVGAYTSATFDNVDTGRELVAARAATTRPYVGWHREVRPYVNTPRIPWLNP